MTLFQEGNTVSNNKLIFPVALKTIIIKYLIQDIDLFKKKYTDYLMSKQNNEWLYSLYQGFILIILRLWYFVVNMYVLFEIVFAVFDYYCCS
jgi:hypothetical protein